MRKISATVAACAAAVSLIGVGGGVAMAESQTTLACHAEAHDPFDSANAVVGRTGCSTEVGGDGWVIENRTWLPDDDVGRTSGDGWGMKVVDGDCGNGPGSYYSEFFSSTGQHARSANIDLC